MVTNTNDTQNDKPKRKPDFVVKIRTEERTSSGNYGYYVIGAAWKGAREGDESIYLDINFPNPFMIDTQTKIMMFPLKQEENE